MSLYFYSTISQRYNSIYLRHSSIWYLKYNLYAHYCSFEPRDSPRCSGYWHWAVYDGVYNATGTGNATDHTPCYYLWNTPWGTEIRPDILMVARLLKLRLQIVSETDPALPSYQISHAFCWQKSLRASFSPRRTLFFPTASVKGNKDFSCIRCCTGIFLESSRWSVCISKVPYWDND